MGVDDAYVFPGFLTPVITQLFFPKPPTTFLTCFCRGEGRKYAGKKSRLNQGDQTRNHQVMSPTRSPLSHPGSFQPALMAQVDMDQEVFCRCTKPPFHRAKLKCK